MTGCSTFNKPVRSVLGLTLRKKKTPRYHAGFARNIKQTDCLDLHVCSLRTFGALFRVVCYLLAFSKCAETLTGDSRKVDKKVFATIGRGYKTKSFGFVKPFYSTCCQNNYLIN